MYNEVDKSKTYSLRKILGHLPCAPSVMDDAMNTRFKLFARFEEGSSFCTNCATLTPSTPRSHHKDCYNYKDIDSYEEQSLNRIGKCPECNDVDSLSIDSSYECESSEITCYVCDFRYQDSLCEEDLIDKFKKHYAH